MRSKHSSLYRCLLLLYTAPKPAVLPAIPRPVLYSTPQSPWSGQSFNMTCELKEFYPKDGIFKLHLFRNDTLIKDDMRNTNDNDKMTVTATDLQETTSTAHKCIAKLTLSNGTTKSTEANLLVQPRGTTFTVYYNSSSFPCCAACEDCEGFKASSEILKSMHLSCLVAIVELSCFVNFLLQGS